MKDAAELLREIASKEAQGYQYDSKRPDWRNPAEYPDPATCSLHRWGWEFLRRNPDFWEEMDAAGPEQQAMFDAGTLPAGWGRRPLGKVLKRWGVLRPLPMHSGFDAPVKFDVAPRDTLHTRINGEWIAGMPMRNDRRLLEFDLDAPIEPQLDRARAMLKASQEHHFPKFDRSRNRIEKFPAYLRLLDATDAGAKRSEIDAGMRGCFSD